MSRIFLYFKLTKSIAVLMIVFVVLASFFIAETVTISLFKLCALAVGVGLSSAGSLALNQYYERVTDGLMMRTRNRPLPSKQLKPKEAKIFGLVLMLTGYCIIWFFVNPLCGLATMACGFSYLYLYTPLKTTSSLSTLSGSIPGALLPLMGWLATYNSFFDFDRLEAPSSILLLTIILYVWQIPHALIICIRYLDDYKNAGMKQLPIVMGEDVAIRHIFLNFFLLFCISFFPAIFEMQNPLVYVICISLLHMLLFFLLYQYKRERKNHLLKALHRGFLLYLVVLIFLIFYYNQNAYFLPNV